MNLSQSEFDPSTLPVHHSVSYWDSEALRRGELINTGQSTFISEPGLDVPVLHVGSVANQLRLVFLSLFANDGLVRRELVRVADTYPGSIDGENFAGHLASWDYWECNSGYLSDSPDDNASDVVVELEGSRIYRLSPLYVEAVLHLCARERLGPSWPRLIHGLSCTYLLPQCGATEPEFDPIVPPRMFGIKDGAIDEYQPIWSVMYETPAGLVPLITPGLGKRETLRRLKRSPVIQTYVREHWDELKGCLGEVIGYKRRRNTSLTAVDHVDWLFRRHILRESTDAIAERSGNHVMTVESSIKEFRRLLDLQPKHAVHCLEHRQRPWPISER